MAVDHAQTNKGDKAANVFEISPDRIGLVARGRGRRRGIGPGSLVCVKTCCR